MSGGPFLSRVKNLLLHPGSEWELIKEEQTSYGKLFSGYLAIIAALPPVSAVLRSVTFDLGIANKSSFVYVLTTNIVWYFVLLLNMFITAVVITVVACRDEPGWIGPRGLKLAVYSFTPAFLVSILMIIPHVNWLIYPAILYSLTLLYLGIRSLFGTEKGKAVWYAATSLAAAVLIVGAMDLIEYMFESYITSKIF